MMLFTLAIMVFKSYSLTILGDQSTNWSVSWNNRHISCKFVFFIHHAYFYQRCEKFFDQFSWEKKKKHTRQMNNSLNHWEYNFIPEFYVLSSHSCLHSLPIVYPECYCMSSLTNEGFLVVQISSLHQANFFNAIILNNQYLRSLWTGANFFSVIFCF